VTAVPLRLAARTFIAALALGTNGAGAGDGTTPPLPALGIDAGQVSVSGISSGGFMAGQLQVAFSAAIMGVGIIAAGPYACAGNGFPWTVWRATNVCANVSDGVPFAGPPALDPSLDAVRSAAARGAIDDPAGLARTRVYLFSGSLDATVPPPVMGVTEAFFHAFAADPARQIAFETTIAAAHSMVTLDFGNACDVSKPPFLSDCDYAAAGSALAHIYGELAAPAPAAATEGRLRSFDQRPFQNGRSDTGLGDFGYLYVPAACEAAGAGCRLHVALHGCEQSASQIGDTFARHAGYNGLAEANRIVVLYAQAAPLTRGWFGLPLLWPNPKGCWDWWGFTGRDYAERSGAQPRAIKAMIDRLAGR